VMDSDESRFGGHDRIAPGQRFIASPVTDGATTRLMIKLYLPVRTAIVLQRT